MPGDPQTSASIRVDGLTKTFGEAVAVDRLSFEVRAGEVYGLLGPNGAGKTTSLRMLAGLMEPTGGSAAVCGLDIREQPGAAKRELGFATGTTALYERLTPVETLRYFGGLYGMERAALAARIEQLVQQLQFEPLVHRRCGTLSTGEKQRVSLARAMVHDPAVLVLDEPTAGLDVVASRFVAGVIREARARGRAILFSTHYMAEAELLCDRIGLLHRGRLLREGPPGRLREQMQARSLEEAFLKLIEQEAAA